MPKLKTHKGASKRFKKTGTGKVVRNHAFARHILTSKSRKRKRKLHRAAQEAVERALKFAYTGRKNKKRDYRSLWIVRINAACRDAGVSYSKFMHGLKAAGIGLDRKVLAEVAASDAAGFRLLV